jgi:hypothetical protein
MRKASDTNFNSPYLGQTFLKESIAKLLNCIVLASALLLTIVGCRPAPLPDFVSPVEKAAMTANLKISQAGIGVIRDESEGYLVVSTCSRKNEILWQLGDKHHNWSGRRSTTVQAVVFFGGKIWYPNTLPQNFDRSQSVVIYFEGNYVRFFDYVHNQGGYFMKYWQN